MIKVSIIIVSYNVRSYVSHAIDSILKSNYNNFEIIVFDDDGNGIVDRADFDKDDNGTSDIIAYDYNQDGEWDKYEEVG